MKLKHKNFLVYGLSVSGEWASKLLRKNKANVYLYDDDLDKAKRLALSGCYFVQELNDNLIEQLDGIIVSPSIPLDNPFLVMANEHNIKIYSELEFASMFSKKLVAITGTNGKTTTVELITAILNQKSKAIACGNIGYPLSRAVIERRKHIKVVEVSSFMLEHAETFSPNVATVLNIAPDHLIRHKTMDEYIRCKKNIFNNLSQSDYAVVNMDEDFDVDKNCIKITYSLTHSADIDLRDGYIRLHGERVVAVNELPLKGNHNISNVMCAIAYGYIYKVSIKKMREAILRFKSDKYRNELVAVINDIIFVNDSKSTNIASTLASVNSTKKAIILLLGGSKKGLDYTELFQHLSKRVKKIYAYGEISDKLVSAGEGFDIEKVEDLSIAFDHAVSIAKPNDMILLSPASASYDQFTSYVERGKLFDKKVREYAIRSKKG